MEVKHRPSSSPSKHTADDLTHVISPVTECLTPSSHHSVKCVMALRSSGHVSCGHHGVAMRDTLHTPWCDSVPISHPCMLDWRRERKRDRQTPRASQVRKEPCLRGLRKAEPARATAGCDPTSLSLRGHQSSRREQRGSIVMGRAGLFSNFSI